MIKLNIGSGDAKMEGYINLDAIWNPKVTDVLYDMVLDELPFEDNSVDEIRSDYTFEHIGPLAHKFCLGEWLRVLKPGGVLHLLVPNILVFCEQALHDAANIPLGEDPTGKQPIPPLEHFYQCMIGLFSQHGKQYRDQYPFLEHRWGFCEGSLKALLEENGFVDVEYRAEFIDPSYEGQKFPTILPFVAYKPKSKTIDFPGIEEL